MSQKTKSGRFMNHENGQKLSVLFVCLGNICRSPTAEAVFRKKVADAQLDSLVCMDSAGTAGYHTGSPPDKRSRDSGSSRGYDFSGIKCRRVQESDFEEFDYIIAMDNANYADLTANSLPDFHAKIRLMMSFADSEFEEVPDPYYGGRKGFELVLDLIELASDGLVEEIKTKLD